MPISEITRKKLSDSHRGLTYPTIQGDRHWNWKGGVTPETEKVRQSGAYKEWRRQVFERDDFTCSQCKQRGGYLHAHHIKSFAKHPELRLDVANGETICRDCHAKEHGLVFTDHALNRCPDCDKKIKKEAKYCLSCRMARTRAKNLELLKCIECGGQRRAIRNGAVRCRSCAAKMRERTVGNFGRCPK